MTWVKLDDGFFLHPKMVSVSALAKILHVAALTYCAQQLTDGTVPQGATAIVASMAGVRRPEAALRELVAAGLWEQTPTGYAIHDYLDYNPSREQVLKERTGARERMAKRKGDSPEPPPEIRPKFARSSPEVQGPRTPTRSSKELLETPSGVLSASADGAPPEGDAEAIDRVWTAYRERIQPKARICPRGKIKARLRTFGEVALLDGIDRFARSPWWMEHNATRGGDWFFDSDPDFERWTLLDPEHEQSRARQIPRVSNGRVVVPAGPSDVCQTPGCYQDPDIRLMCSKPKHRAEVA